MGETADSDGSRTVYGSGALVVIGYATLVLAVTGALAWFIYEPGGDGNDTLELITVGVVYTVLVLWAARGL
ncbi:MAG: hypothetical protein ABEI11_03320 [Haloarculaceae archaeon]